MLRSASQVLGIIGLGALLVACEADLADPPATGDDAGADATPDALVCGACPQTHGPMISINTGSTCFCIDATEVTQGAYLAFTTSGALPTMPPQCSFKTSNNPSNGASLPWPPVAGTEQRPVATVDWCDAFAYCAYAGKRLCGPIGGGAIDLTRTYDPMHSEMLYACSGGGTRVYPYGDTYDADACWGEHPGSMAVDVGSFAGCEGGVPGLFDLSGNVMEWDAFCPDEMTCNVRGGGKHYDEPRLRCDFADVSMLTRRNTDVGFRCCADPL